MKGEKKKLRRTITARSRIFVNEPTFLCIDMHAHAEQTWVKVELTSAGIVLDHSCIDGELILSPEHATLDSCGNGRRRQMARG